MRKAPLRGGAFADAHEGRESAALADRATTRAL